MPLMDKIASSLGRRDEIPNQELAADLATRQDRDGIRELVLNLRNRDRKIQSDCIKVLYEVGYRSPELIALYVDEFLSLLKSRNNRLVWGSMIALVTIAPLKAGDLFVQREEIMRAVDQGSVITTDNGIKALSLVAAADRQYQEALFPYLLDHLSHCRPKDVPQHAESVLMAVNSKNKDAFIDVITTRLSDMHPAQAKRLKKVLVQAENC